MLKLGSICFLISMIPQKLDTKLPNFLTPRENFVLVNFRGGGREDFGRTEKVLSPPPPANHETT